MKKGWWWWFALVALAGIGAAWFALVYRDPLFRIKPVRERLLDTLPATGTARFRDEVIGREGALCGQVANVNGGRRIDAGPDAGERNAAGSRLVALDSAQWRRFIVVPSVPAFHVEGLAPWGVSLDGRKIAVDALELEQERAGFVEQYAAAAGYDGIDANRTAEEITLKTLEEHFEVRWAQYCAPGP